MSSGLRLLLGACSSLSPSRCEPGAGGDRVALDPDVVTFADRPPPKAGAGNELLMRFCSHEQARIALNKAAELRADKRAILMVTRGADENARRYDDT